MPQGVKKEIAEAISVINSKNAVVGSSISAGRDVKIAIPIRPKVSLVETSAFCSLFLVPILAIGGAYLWYRNQVLQKPFSFKVQLQDISKNNYLPKAEGKITWIDQESSLSKAAINQEATFDGRNPKYRNEPVRILFEAEGFEKVDTSLIPKNDLMMLPIQRDDRYAHMQGIIYQFDTDPLEGLEGVIVSIPCCSDTTDAQGNFSFSIPLAEQRVEHRMDIYKNGFYLKSPTEPVVKGNTIRNYLEKK